MKKFLTICLVATVCCALALDASARTVRVATFNILNGVGTPGSTEYNAVKSILQRIDADVIGFQELQTADKSNWETMASQLGYGYTAFSSSGPLSGPIYVGYFSRFPILSTYNVVSPQNCSGETVKEITRPPFRAVVDVDGAEKPLALWVLHHKAAFEPDDPFRRAIEAIRCAEDIDAWLAANPGDDEYVVLGDFNADKDFTQPVDFTWSEYLGLKDDWLPSTYHVGCDIIFPVPYATFPRDAYEVAGNGMAMLPATHEDSSADNTFISSSARFDYIFVSSNLWTSPLGVPAAEVYNSAADDGLGSGGLPKAGSPLPSGTSTNASDHYAVFADIHMTDVPPPVPPRIDLIAAIASAVSLEFQTVLNSTYTVEFNDDLTNTNGWFAVSDFIDVPGTGSVMTYVDDGSGTGTAPSNTVVRFYRLEEQLP